MLKKILKKKIFISICAIIVLTGGCLLLFRGCGGSGESLSSEESRDAYYSGSDSALTDNAESEASDESASGTTDISAAEQKMITTWDFSIESADYEGSISRINQTVQALKGYIEYENESNQNDELRCASYVIRIPDKDEDNWLDKVGELGTIVEKSKNVENITLRYIDTESRLRSLKTERTALTKLLESAEKVEDIIKVQSELTNVNSEIESYESQIRTMENDINYMTVNLNISEVKHESAQKPGIADEIRERFVNAADGITGFVRALFINIVGYSLYIILIVIAAAILWRVYRKRKSKHEERREDSDH